MRTHCRRIATLSVLVALAGAGVAAAKSQPAWLLLGERTVTDAVDHDVIPVTKAEGTYQAIRLKVFERAVQFRRVVIHFGNGTRQEVELRTVIPAGGESRVIDVAGGDRVINRIELVYDAQSLAGHRAVVRVFGKR